MISSTFSQSDYVPIPQFPASLDGQWKQITKTPYFKTIMKFKAGRSLVSSTRYC